MWTLVLMWTGSAKLWVLALMWIVGVAMWAFILKVLNTTPASNFATLWMIGAMLWTIAVVSVVGAINSTSLSVPNFESKEVCEKAFNALKSEVTWGHGFSLVGICVSLK